jgi:hypothetical protein
MRKNGKVRKNRKWKIRIKKFYVIDPLLLWIMTFRMSKEGI